MKYLFYTVTGFVFSWGLLLSGMTDPQKIKDFLELGGPRWSPALLFVLFPAALVYLGVFLLLQKQGKTLNGIRFAHPPARPTDRRMVVGSLIFGIGWGLSGICPGPALVHLAFPDSGFLIFVASMILGFEMQRKY